MTIRALNKTHISRFLAVAALLFLLSAPGVPACRAGDFPFPSGKFTFDGKRNIGTAKLINTSVTNAALFLNGVYSVDCGQYRKPSDKGYVAIFRPSVFNYERFTTVVKLRPESLKPIENLHPENTSPRTTLLAGGDSTRWFVLSSDQDGKVELLLNNGHVSYPIHNLTLTNGQWTTLALTVDLQAEAIAVYANGTRVDELLLAKDFVFDVDHDDDWKEHDKVLTFTDYSCGETFHGLVAGLLTFDAVLTSDQVRQLFPKR
jgi:hypothetical protein